MSYQVFISFKNLDKNGNPTRDSVLAAEMYRKLRERGIEVFFSNEEVQRKSRPDYSRFIDEALDSAKILILVGTCVEYIESRWVKYEWDSFKIEINSGRKDGHIIPLLEGVEVGELPYALRHGQVYSSAEMDKAADMAAGMLGMAAPQKKAPTADPKTSEKADELIELGDKYYYGTGGMAQDYAEAVRCYRQAAELGSTYAKVSIGFCYQAGNGVEKDMDKAFVWYKEAAEQGDKAGQCILGNCYHMGSGTAKSFEKNDVLAVMWYRKAAEQGHPIAQLRLGEACEKGEGTYVDTAEAISWYRRSAAGGNAEAHYRLGECYRLGVGVERDANEARRWYGIAADRGNKQAKDALARLG